VVRRILLSVFKPLPTNQHRLGTLIRTLLQKKNTGKQPASKKQTFKDYGDSWLENCAKGAIKDSTYQEYESVLRNHVYPLLGSKPFAKVDRVMIRG
jgi:hypothetical protein